MDLEVDVEEKNGGIPLVFLGRHLSKNLLSDKCLEPPSNQTKGIIDLSATQKESVLECGHFNSPQKKRKGGWKAKK